MKIYNTMNRRKEDLIIKNNTVKIYACGPTVYNFIHIGNARPLCVFDVLRRYLIYKGFNVLFVQNFTDIDDKIIDRAREENIGFNEVSEKYIREYKKDSSGMNVLEADVHPRATETINEIVDMVKTLVDKGFAYESDGDVYFESLKFKDYGKLSGQLIDELMSGARVEKSDKKRNYLDFALWKASKEGEPWWESPWSKGRPGWHIECSCMIKKHLGKTIDIHCGGQDLIFPHHENEIAQSECANGCTLSRYWMHNGFINVENKKMSKSLNNFFTVREIAQKYGYSPIRYLMISSHYRSPLNFSEEVIKQCQNSLERLSNFRNKLNIVKSKNSRNNLGDILDLKSVCKNFEDFMDDDLNTSGALSVIFDMIKTINSNISENDVFSEESVDDVLNVFDKLTGVLGISFETKKKIFSDEILKMISDREEARKNKDWNKSDKLRLDLEKLGIVVSDSRSGESIYS